MYYNIYSFYTQIFVLLFFTACQGQVVKNESDKTLSALTKIPKPRGSYSDAAIGCGWQDKAGNLWFGSNGEGLYRYDGKTFTNFTTKDGLDNNIVYSVLEDKAGNLWVGTKTGLNRYDGKTFQHIPIVVKYNLFSTSNQSDIYNPFHQNGVWSMMQDKNGLLWFGTDYGVFCYDGTNFTHFLDHKQLVNAQGLKLKAIFSILEDKAGAIWFAACAEGGIARFDGSALVNVVPHDMIRRTDKIVEAKNGDLWFAAVFNGLCRYDGETFTKNLFKEKENAGPHSLVEDDAGNLWFNTRAGLGCYDGKTLKILTEKEGAPNEIVRPILKDNVGNLWFAGEQMGLYRYNGKTFSRLSE